MPFEIVSGDITKMSVDAIVNAANSSLKMGSGVCGSIFKAAGSTALQAECDSLGGCDTGCAVITKGYDLNCKYIIHTVGPIWRSGVNQEEKYLADCYRNSLLLAHEYGCSSVAFPLISTGIYRYPKAEALKIATKTIEEFLSDHDISVSLVIFDKSSYEMDNSLRESIQKYIDVNYVEEELFFAETCVSDVAFVEEIYEDAKISKEMAMPAPACRKAQRKLDDVIKQLDETFSEKLLRLIDEKGRTDVEIYKRANIDRKLFSKIRGDKYYRPSKNTAIAFAIALRLNVDETKDILKSAGYALSKSSKFDVIVEFFLEEENYNIFEINEALFAFDQPLLGA